MFVGGQGWSPDGIWSLGAAFFTRSLPSLCVQLSPLSGVDLSCLPSYERLTRLFAFFARLRTPAEGSIPSFMRSVRHTTPSSSGQCLLVVADGVVQPEGSVVSSLVRLLPHGGVRSTPVPEGPFYDEGLVQALC